jgi:YgiT-type zinc finger domain-containing protein
MASCPICRQGELRPGTSDEVMTHDGMTLVIKDVPADICDTCGEAFFSESVTQRLLDLAGEAAAAGVEIDVRRYIAA